MREARTSHSVCDPPSPWSPPGESVICDHDPLTDQDHQKRDAGDHEHGLERAFRSHTEKYRHG
jgi:hypothetical protein